MYQCITKLRLPPANRYNSVKSVEMEYAICAQICSIKVCVGKYYLYGLKLFWIGCVGQANKPSPPGWHMASGWIAMENGALCHKAQKLCERHTSAGMTCQQTRLGLAFQTAIAVCHNRNNYK